MRFPLIARQLRPAQHIQTKPSYSMSVAEFVAAAEKAEPALKGSNQKDQQAIQKLSGEVEGLAKDVSVSPVPPRLCRYQRQHLLWPRYIMLADRSDSRSIPD